MTATASELTPRERILAVASALGLTMTAEFIPYSIAKATRADWSADPAKPWRGLSWRVQLRREAPSSAEYPPPQTRCILEITYSMGEGHAPAYKRPVADRDRPHMIAWECENGRPAGGARFDYSAGHDGRGAWVAFAKVGGKPILPDLADVLASVASDSDVLDAGGFEEWASDFGYDTDSRKAEATYRACLDIALKLRAAIGEAGLEQLREAARDF